MLSLVLTSYLAAPTAYTIRVIGTDQIVNITFINAPIPNRIIAANVPYVDIVLLAGRSPSSLITRLFLLYTLLIYNRNNSDCKGCQWRCVCTHTVHRY